MNLQDPSIKTPDDIYNQFCMCLESAKGEREVTNFLKEHLYILRIFDHPWNAKYAKSEVMLGNDYKVDFITLSADSGQWYARLIEAQSPKDIFYTKNLRESEQLGEARRQIAEWKTWIENHHYDFRELLSKIVDADCPACCSNASVHQRAKTELTDKNISINIRYIALIGRSEDRISETKINQLISANGDFEVATYDRLLRYAKTLSKNS